MKIHRKKKLLVNALPMMKINTGIARYLECLYSELEKTFPGTLDIWYFDGKTATRSRPRGPENYKSWSKILDVFWKLPAYPALLLRIAHHYQTEIIFYKIVKGFDIYHEAGFFPFQTPQRVKTILTVHDLCLFRFPEYHPRERVLFNRLFFKTRCRNVDYYLSVSEFTRTEMQIWLGLPDQKITVTPLAHDPLVFYPRSQESIDHFKTQQGLPEKYFLFVGSGDPRKNMEVIPKALERAGLDIPLLAIGWSGWSQERLPVNVRIMGYVEDHELALLYAGALALIFPSKYEGFGLPVLEAMACGCPVVTTQNASLPEVAGDAAVYVNDPDDPKELGLLLQKLAFDPEENRLLKFQGIERASEFSWQQTAQICGQACEFVVSGGRQ